MTGYAIYAIRYATLARRAQDNYIAPVDAHGAAGAIDYFLWAVVGGGRTVVVDCGFNEESGRRRGRTWLRCPGEGLKAVGIDPAEVDDLVITHLHYDHAGNLPLFPKSRIHVQDDEVAYATGRHMRHPFLAQAFDVEDVVGLVREVYRDRVEFHDGDGEVAPGIELFYIGGHTAGLQVVRVETARGRVVLASDASHLYGNMDLGNPFPVVLDVGGMLEGHRRLRALADSPDHVVPGHDPKVMEIYPVAGPGLEGVAVRLDLPPRL